ncbi:caspase-3-like [Metopolophium dirhodum]|uniref:caspase-3-like n=1 Tax=Metopolophium dirhodum TaxID=44670 RepID=UPI00299064A5|nr:caspase-3-like [Metopolophium dirhodum]
MEQYHQKLINDCMSDLIYVTSDLETIVENLLEKNENEGELNKKTTFYKLIQGRGPDAFTSLCRVLEETNNIKACNILTSSQTSEKEEQQLSSIELLDTMSFKNTISEHDEPYVKIHPDPKSIENDVNNLQSGHDVYPMRSNPKGHALILNINNIKDKDKITGFDVDMANVNKLFKGLGFIVHSKADLTEREIKNVINEFMSICRSEKANSIVVFIICHGVTGKDSTRSTGMLTEDGITINTDWLIEQFLHKKLSGNIPMLFFIDACRGPDRDFGWKYCSGENNYIQNYDDDMYPIGTISDQRYQDVFIAYATVPGHTAIRDPLDGSWFIQKLCQVFCENAYNTELARLMCLVDIKLDELSRIDHRSQTAEWSFRGFRKKFYFNPGLYEDNSDNNILMTSSTNPTDI